MYILLQWLTSNNNEWINDYIKWNNDINIYNLTIFHTLSDISGDVILIISAKPNKNKF